MSLSIVIPVYKNSELFFKNLKRNYQYLKKHQVIVIDDASKENIKKKIIKLFPNIEVYENSENKGFGFSVNRAVEKAKEKYILLLNSDTMLLDNSFEQAYLRFARDKELFAVSFLQIERNERFVGRNMLYFEKGLIQHKESDEIIFGKNAWAEGGACIIKRSYFNKLGGFDEVFCPFYWEDIDLSYRAYKRGWYVLFDPNIKVEHFHESTIGRYFNKDFIDMTAFRNQLIFIWKNMSDSSLLFRHFLFLPYHIFIFLLQGKISYIKGFLQAILKVPSIIKRRRSEKKYAIINDGEILCQREQSIYC